MANTPDEFISTDFGLKIPDAFISTDFGPKIKPPPKLSASQAVLKRSSYPFCGRLIVLESGRTTGYQPFPGLSSFTAINFPSMPDSIELARAVEYLVTPNMVMPDAIHQYKWTNPLIIPFSFKLHAMDKEYCPQGSLSLLQLAGLLHSFSLPISKNLQASLTVPKAQSNPGAKPKTDEATNASSGQSADSPLKVIPDSNDDFFPPVTLRLELVFVDESSPGITCTGYIKDVRAKLNGPWLRGPGRSYNLPTSADFEFSFVHVPGYGNNFSVVANPLGQDATMVQAFANNVKQKLYNTVDLTPAFSQNYKGLSN